MKTYRSIHKSEFLLGFIDPIIFFFFALFFRLYRPISYSIGSLATFIELFFIAMALSWIFYNLYVYSYVLSVGENEFIETQWFRKKRVLPTSDTWKIKMKVYYFPGIMSPIFAFYTSISFVNQKFGTFPRYAIRAKLDMSDLIAFARSKNEKIEIDPNFDPKSIIFVSKPERFTLKFLLKIIAPLLAFVFIIMIAKYLGLFN